MRFSSIHHIWLAGLHLPFSGKFNV